MRQMFPLRPIIIILWIIILLPVGALWIKKLFPSKQNLSQLLDPPIEIYHVKMLDGVGETVSLSDFRGMTLLLFFGYSHCPDYCPNSLYYLSKAYEKLSAEEKTQLAVIMVSVDPIRDDSKTIQDYVTHYHQDFIGLTGSEENINALSKQFFVFYTKIKNPQDPNEYLIDHTTHTFVVDVNGRLFATLSQSEIKETKQLAKELKKYIRNPLKKIPFTLG